MEDVEEMVTWTDSDIVLLFDKVYEYCLQDQDQDLQILNGFSNELQKEVVEAMYTQVHLLVVKSARENMSIERTTTILQNMGFNKNVIPKIIKLMMKNQLEYRQRLKMIGRIPTARYQNLEWMLWNVLSESKNTKESFPPRPEFQMKWKTNQDSVQLSCSPETLDDVLLQIQRARQHLASFQDVP